MSLSISTIVDIRDDNHEPSSPAVPQPASKKHGSPGSGHHVSIFGAAALLARRKKAKALAKKPVAAAQSGEKSLWRTLLGSLRPLHGPHDPDQIVKQVDADDVEHGTMPALAIPVRPPPLSVTSFKVEEAFKDAVSPMVSPSRSSVSSLNSLYASADDLHGMDVDLELDVNLDVIANEEGHKEGEEEQISEESKGPNEIDLKAEEFIQNFYEEMKRTPRGSSMDDIDIN